MYSYDHTLYSAVSENEETILLRNNEDGSISAFNKKTGELETPKRKFDIFLMRSVAWAIGKVNRLARYSASRK